MYKIPNKMKNQIINLIKKNLNTVEKCSWWKKVMENKN